MKRPCGVGARTWRRWTLDQRKLFASVKADVKIQSAMLRKECQHLNGKQHDEAVAHNVAFFAAEGMEKP